MNISIQKSESHTCLKVLHEKLDALLAPDLKSALVVIVEDGEKNILVDLSNCNYCDSSGMSALLLGNRLCAGVNGAFVLCGLSSRVKEMMTLVGFDSLMKIADTREKAEEFFV